MSEEDIEKQVVGFNPKGMKPGVVQGRRIFDLVNTSKPYKKAGKGKLGKHMKRLSERRNAHSDTIKSGDAAAYRIPGSMKQKSS